MPKVTIGVTTYNRPEYLRRCIRSILNQKYQNFEIVIGNDYVPVPVTFETLGIPPDHRIRILNYEVNIGAYNNNYSLIRKAEGDYFTWLADDDLMHPLFLQKAYDALAATEALAFFSSYSEMVIEEEDFLAASHDDGELTVYDCRDFISDYASRRIRAVGCYGIFKKQVLEAIYSAPKFGTGLAVYVDTFIPLIVASLGGIAYWNKDLVYLRTHSGSQSASSSALEEYSSAQVDFMKELQRVFEGSASNEDLEKWTCSFLWWFVQDSWHVVVRGTKSNVVRIRQFLSYYRKTVKGNVPKRCEFTFKTDVAALVGRDVIRQVGSNLLSRVRRKSAVISS